jgi:hypothetical protein
MTIGTAIALISGRDCNADQRRIVMTRAELTEKLLDIKREKGR